MQRTRHILTSSSVVILLLGLGKITGLARVKFVFEKFGTGSEIDAFTAANQLPEVFVTLISGGALAAALIPVYSALLKSERHRDRLRLANSVLNLVLIVLGLLSAIGIFFAPVLSSRLLVPDFDAAQQELTSELMRIILLQTTLFGVSGVLSSLLNAHQHFALPALAPIALDLGYGVGLWVFEPLIGIHGLAWGTVVGGLLHIAIQIPALTRYHFSYSPIIAKDSGSLREVVYLMGPRIVTLGAIQIADLFIIRLTSGLPSGSTSGYFYGYTLMQLPETLIGTAIAIVVFPTLAELYNAGDIESLKRTATGALQVIWTLAFPATTALIFLGRNAIEVFLEAGAFSAVSTAIVYGGLRFFSFRVISEATLEILARLFYARHDTKTPMFVAAGWLTVNVSLAYALIRPMGMAGLALASTIAFTVQSIVLYLLSRRSLGKLDENELLKTAMRSFLGSLVMAAFILLINRAITNSLSVLVLGGAGGILLYFLVTLASGGQELPTLLRLVRHRQK